MGLDDCVNENGTGVTSKTLAGACLLAFLGLGDPAAAGAPAAPHAGLEAPEIKALSADEIAGYREGKGMGLAAAELNHYPVPAHVLELSTELGLTPHQRSRTEELFKAMETEAISLGKQLLERERQLDDLFARKTIMPERLRRSLEAIGLLQGRLRLVHLQTHLAQAKILDAEQTRKYEQLRGYGDDATPAHHLYSQYH